MTLQSGGLLRSRNRLLLVLVLLLCSSRPALTQIPPDSVRPGAVPAIQVHGAENRDSARHEAATRLVAVAEEILSVRPGDRDTRTRLLAEAQHLADRIDGLDLELQLTGHGHREDPHGRDDPLTRAIPTLRALAGAVAEERQRLGALRRRHDELRLFLGTLRLFDETGMPPAARGDGGGDPDPGCPVTSCPMPGSPADVPLAHFQPGADREGQGAIPVTLSSLARLQEQVAARAGLPPVPDGEGEARFTTVTREAVLGAGAMTFHGDGDGVSGLGSRGGASFLMARPLGRSTQLIVEPAVGGRALRFDPSTITELAAELRAALAGGAADGRVLWQVASWQKGRFLSDPLPPPGYLEPGRWEGGLAGQLAVPLRDHWALEIRGGGDLVRYGPEDWKILDRQGIDAAAGVAWRGDPASVRLSLLGSRHTFARSDSPLPRREDTRTGVEVDASVAGTLVVRVSAGLAWNDSPLAAYDYTTQRLAVVLSAPRGRGSIQAYGALAHQNYLNPGPEEGRVAPSDHDSGSILALQYTLPLDATRVMGFRAEWARSETGFRNDFYQRFGVGVQVGFRGLRAVQDL